MKKFLVFFVLAFSFLFLSCQRQHSFDPSDYTGKAVATSSSLLCSKGYGITNSLSVEVIDKEGEKHEFVCFSSEPVSIGEGVFVENQKVVGRITEKSQD
jgi:hypothetical protein